MGMPGPPAASGAPPAAAPAAAAAAYGIPAGSDWTGHKAPDGRTYFYNTKTKQSSWSKPKELMTPLELADSQTPWKVRASYAKETGHPRSLASPLHAPSPACVVRWSMLPSGTNHRKRLGHGTSVGSALSTAS